MAHCCCQTLLSKRIGRFRAPQQDWQCFEKSRLHSGCTVFIGKAMANCCFWILQRLKKSLGQTLFSALYCRRCLLKNMQTVTVASEVLSNANFCRNLHILCSLPYLPFPLYQMFHRLEENKCLFYHLIRTCCHMRPVSEKSSSSAIHCTP